jgi:hypothetical protein
MAMLRALAAWFDARRRLIALALTGWAVLVVVGAGRGPDSTEWIGIPDLSGVVVAMLAVAMVLGFALLGYLRPRLQRGPMPARRTSSLRVFVLAAIVAALLAIWLDPPENSIEEDAAGPVPTATARPDDFAGDAAPGIGTRTGDVVTVLLIGLAAGMVLLWIRHRRPLGPGVGVDPETTLEAQLEDAVAEAARRLHAGTEPRAAVLVAYAGLEDSLAARGRPRHPAETPTEHMTRVLAVLPALVGPAVRLGRLYELARFSDHPITGDDRDQAAAALRRARHALDRGTRP